MRRVAAILMLIGMLPVTCTSVRADEHVRTKHLIVPGVGVGDFKLGTSKDDVLKKLGKPKLIYWENTNYTLENLPTRYRLLFADVEFEIIYNLVDKITARSPSYKFANGLGVGDSEDKIKQAFGSDFHLDDGLVYADKRLRFNIDKVNRTVKRIIVYRPPLYHNPLPGPLVFPKIDRRPQPDDDDRTEELKSLPKYDPDSDNCWQMDLRSRDLSKLDLRNSIDDLLYTTFDGRTVWPASDKMPPGFDRHKIMELGKNLGLGVRSLHKKGITGRGVRIAIVDQPLLVDHQEYVDRLQLYEEIHIQIGMKPEMHGVAIASIAVGKTVGVAPEAELFYIGQYNSDWEQGDAGTLRYLAAGIDRIVEINEQLSQDKKIRVISISRGWTEDDLRDKEFSVITAAVQKAQAAGMLVICMSARLVNQEYAFNGLGRSPLADPDVFESYEPGRFLVKSFWADGQPPYDGNLWVPMDALTTASPKGIDEYLYYRTGGGSWNPPYIAGLYALAVQVDPSITPERFCALAVKTGRTTEVEREGQRRPLGPIIDPVRLIRSIEAGESFGESLTIVPGVGIGDFTLGMSKDEVLKELGEPDSIQLGENEVVHRGDEKYTLDSLSGLCILTFSDILFWIADDSVEVISVRNPRYRLSNGLGVGDSKQKVKQTFGEGIDGVKFGRNLLVYRARGFGFTIQENQTVAEIIVFEPDVDRSEKAPEPEHTIVPGVGIGDFKLGTSKDDVLKELGEPDVIQFGEDEVVHRGDEKYTLDSLPTQRCILTFGGIHLWIGDDSVRGIGVRCPRYRLANGLGVGDPEQRLKQAFGGDVVPFKAGGRNFLCYRAKGIGFTTQKSQTVAEILVFKPDVDRSDNDSSKLEMHNCDDLEAFEGVDDARGCDLRNAADILDTLSFDQETLWPPAERLPEGFDPQALLEEGMNPGLGVRDLHARGITGAGVNVGLIDQPLLLDHPEYAGKILSYHHPSFESHHSSGHGPAMVSLLVGERCGTAPGAKLHVVAVPSWNRDAGGYARALDRFIEYNEDASKEGKIRVVSVSCQPSGEGSVFNNQALWDKAVERAQAEGILVLDCTWHHGFVSLCWLDSKDRENVAACTPGFRGGAVEVDEGHIHVPAKPRSWARAPEDRRFGYAYDGGSRGTRRAKAKSGYSPAIPYVAGVLALGWQVRPDLAPAQMKELLFESAHVHESGAMIINPTAFIDLIRKRRNTQESELRSSGGQWLKLAKPLTSDGFVSMFDGKTLAGWHAVPKDSASDWTVRDKAIVGRGSVDRQAYLVWEDGQLTDFELRLRYRLLTEGNTGVEIRSRPDPSGKRPFEGYHADLGHVGIGPHILGAWDFHFARREEYPCARGTRLVIDEEGQTQSTRILGALTLEDVHRGQWNDVRVIARGNHFQFFVNGKLASEFTDNAKHGRLTRGAIGLQLHDKGMHVEFKDLRLKRLISVAGPM